MGEVVVGTNGVILLPDPLRCPRHPTWHIAVREQDVRRTLGRDGYHYEMKWVTGKCPECGWKPTDLTGRDT